MNAQIARLLLNLYLAIAVCFVLTERWNVHQNSEGKIAVSFLVVDEIEVAVANVVHSTLHYKAKDEVYNELFSCYKYDSATKEKE